MAQNSEIVENLVGQLERRGNHLNDLVIDFSVRYLIGRGKDPNVFLAQVKNRAEVSEKLEWDEAKTADVLRALVALEDRELPAEFLEALRDSDFHTAFSGLKAPKGVAWLVGALILLGGADLELGPVGVEVPGAIEIYEQLTDEQLLNIKELLTLEVPPDAPYISKKAIAPSGVYLDDARSIAKEIDQRFREGKIRLPELRSSTKQYNVKVKPWHPDANTLTDRYLIGAGVAYQSFENNEVLFTPSITVFLPSPQEGSPKRILLDIKALEAAVGHEARVKVAYGGIVKGLAGFGKLQKVRDRLPVGCSISHPGGLTGSITCFVDVKGQKQRCLLTSGHVATDYGRTPKGTALKRPTATDPNADISMLIGALAPLAEQGSSIVPDTDCAVAKLENGIIDDGNHILSSNGERITNVVEIDPDWLRGGGLVVDKHGSGSKPVTGYVSTIDQTAFYRSPDGNIVYEIADQLQIRTNPGDLPFAVAQDSGAAVTVRQGQRDLGLVGQIVCGNGFGGKDGLAYATPASSLIDGTSTKLVGS